jgi:hypothetical protein
MGIKIKYGGLAFLVDESTGRPVGLRDERDGAEYFIPIFDTSQTGLRKPDGSTAVVGGGGSSMPTMGSFVYTGGLLTSFVEDGITYTIGRDGNGRMTTLTGGGTTRTVQRDGNGKFIGWA